MRLHDLKPLHSIHQLTTTEANTILEVCFFRSSSSFSLPVASSVKKFIISYCRGNNNDETYDRHIENIFRSHMERSTRSLAKKNRERKSFLNKRKQQHKRCRWKLKEGRKKNGPYVRHLEKKRLFQQWETENLHEIGVFIWSPMLTQIRTVRRMNLEARRRSTGGCLLKIFNKFLRLFAFCHKWDYVCPYMHGSSGR